MLIGKAACQKCRYLWKLCDIHFEKKKHPYFKLTFNNVICYVQAYLCLWLYDHIYNLQTYSYIINISIDRDASNSKIFINCV